MGDPLTDLVVSRNDSSRRKQQQRGADDLNGSFAVFDEDPGASGFNDSSNLEDCIGEFDGHDSNVFAEARSANANRLKPHKSFSKRRLVTEPSLLDGDRGDDDDDDDKDPSQFYPFSNKKNGSSPPLSNHLKPSDKQSSIKTNATAQTEETSVETEDSQELNSNNKLQVAGAYVVNSNLNQSRSKSRPRGRNKLDNERGDDEDQPSSRGGGLRRQDSRRNRRTITRTRSVKGEEMKKNVTRIKVRGTKSGEGLMDNETARKLITEHLAKSKSDGDINLEEENEPEPRRGRNRDPPKRRGVERSRSRSVDKRPDSAEAALQALVSDEDNNAEDGEWTTFEASCHFNQSDSGLDVGDEDDDDENKYYSLADLQEKAVDGLDYGNREHYLSPPDFQEAFGCTKEEYIQFPKWKQTKLKRAANLF